MGHLDPQKRRRIRGDRPRERGPETGKESPIPAFGPELPHHTTNTRVGALGGGLQPALDGIDGEDGDPHGDAGGASRDGDGAEAQLALRLPRRGVDGRQAALHVLVGGEVGGGAGGVAGEGGGGPAEHGRDAALAVELARHVDAAAVLGLFSRLQVLRLRLQDHLDPLEGRRDQRHGEGAEGPRRRDLRYGEGAVGGGRRCRRYDLLAEFVAPEGYGD